MHIARGYVLDNPFARMRGGLDRPEQAEIGERHPIDPDREFAFHPARFPMQHAATADRGDRAARMRDDLQAVAGDPQLAVVTLGGQFGTGQQHHAGADSDLAGTGMQRQRNTL